MKKYTAIVQVNNKVKVPYDLAKGNIKIKSKDGKEFYILIGRHRVLEIKWVNHNLLYINNQLGHAAGLYSIYDCKNKKWLIHEVVTYK